MIRMYVKSKNSKCVKPLLYIIKYLGWVGLIRVDNQTHFPTTIPCLSTNNLNALRVNKLCCLLHLVLPIVFVMNEDSFCYGSTESTKQLGIRKIHNLRWFTLFLPSVTTELLCILDSRLYFTLNYDKEMRLVQYPLYRRIILRRSNMCMNFTKYPYNI